MHDTSALDHPPFDAAKLPQTDDEIQAFLGRGSDKVVRPSIRRTFAPADFTGLEPAKEHHPEVAPAEGQGSEDAGEVAADPVNPSHYRKHPSGIECIEVTRHMNFNVGNAIKYLWRYMDKGDPIENLKKAQWYIDDEIRRLQGLR